MLKAIQGTVVVSRGDLERDARGTQRAPGSLILLGREVDPPWAHVVASGDDELKVGEVVVVQPDLGRTFDYRGMRVQKAATSREACEDRATMRPLREVLARKVDDTDWPYRAPSGRVVLRLVPAPDASELLDLPPEVDGFDRGEDHEGRVYLVKKRDGFIWHDGDGDWLSAREEVVQAEQAAA
ncbi:MAG: hypothetical protein IV100_17775 [Myxococcales bacterium]|nr:hypothetical protein [Myxococcales bacterium]